MKEITDLDVKPLPKNNYCLSDDELKEFIIKYPTTKAEDLALMFNLKQSQVYKLSRKLKLKKERKKIEVTVTSATCSTCKIVKPASSFSRESKSKNGLQSNCKECSKKSKRLRYKGNPIIDPPPWSTRKRIA